MTARVEMDCFRRGTQGIGLTAAEERALRERALSDAASLFHDHGARAIAMLSGRLIDQSRSAAQRRCDRLTVLAIERLDRARRAGGGLVALVAWRPPLLSLAGIARLFGVKLKSGSRVSRK